MRLGSFDLFYIRENTFHFHIFINVLKYLDNNYIYAVLLRLDYSSVCREINAGVTNNISEGSVIFRYRALINVISNTCVYFLFQVKMAAVKSSIGKYLSSLYNMNATF